VATSGGDWASLPTSRKAAIAAGAKKYFTGKPCKRGHVAPHYVSGPCVICQREVTDRWQREHRDRVRDFERRHYAQHRSEINEKQKGLRRDGKKWQALLRLAAADPSFRRAVLAAEGEAAR
jgi:hypothetical protein